MRRLMHDSFFLQFFAILAYLLLSLVVTYPLIAHFSTEALGEHYPDRVQNMWNLWWVKSALLDLHSNPFHTDVLFYPYGADLYFHTLNLPLALVTLPSQLAYGVVAAYNFGVLFALVLAGYAGWRLTYSVTHHWWAAFVAGVIIGFNPLAMISTRSQINLVSSGWFVLCIEFYLHAWDMGRPRYGVLAGLFFTLAMLTVGYYEVHLLIFFAIHAVWMLLSQRGKPWRMRFEALVARRTRLAIGWAIGTAILLAGPYALSAWLSLRSGQLMPHSPIDSFRSVLNSADMLSFLLPYREHWLLGQLAPWWSWVNPQIQDHTYLGVVAVVLATIGVWARRQHATTWLWVAMGVAGALLAMGPILQVDGQDTFGGMQIPMVFGLFQDAPPFSLVRFPERFIELTYVALGVLAADGLLSLIIGRGFARRALTLVAILGLLLLDMPLYERATSPMTFPSTIKTLINDRTTGPILELPFTKHDWPDAIRMYYQIGHGRPTTSGYLSRTIPDPFGQACSPFHAFVLYRPAEAHDIITPTVYAQIPALVAEQDISFVVVYKVRPVTSQRMDALPDWELNDLQGVAERIGIPIADDEVATVYRVRPTEPSGLFLQLGPGWYSLEGSNGAPFRWINGNRADLCVSSPAAQVAPLTFQVLSFGAPRHLQVWVDDRQVLDTSVAAGWTPQIVTTAPLAWPAGPQLVRLLTPEAPVSPANLGLSSDPRALSLGFLTIKLGAATP